MLANDNRLHRLANELFLYLSGIAQAKQYYPSASETECEAWSAERWGGNLDQTRLYWGEAGREHASISPYCIPAHSTNWAQVREHLLVQDGWGMGLQLAWFMRAYAPRDQLVALVKHLRQWSLISTPSGESAILRIGDWQVVNPLPCASTAQEASALYGPVASYCDITPTGRIQALTLLAREAHPTPESLPRALSAAQWQALLEPAQRQEQAQRNGFNNDRDIVRWLALATELGPDFPQQPWAQTLLSQPENIGIKSRMDRLYQAAIDQLDEA
ncbi:MAG: DUF4123 domain-containing protein [Symbiopectobacterium sp.]|uniref:DUF4123 domain-containing protein n=1 Tax=Symbiopectobacterium sp. TaxID=2952789 RepID=UPI0039EB3426